MKRVREPNKTCVAADFTDGAENGNRAELLQDIRIPEQDPFKSSRLLGRQMGPNNFGHGGNFFDGKTEPLQDWWSFADRVSDIVPCCERDRVFGTMSDENAEVMHPG